MLLRGSNDTSSGVQSDMSEFCITGLQFWRFKCYIGDVISSQIEWMHLKIAFVSFSHLNFLILSAEGGQVSTANAGQSPKEQLKTLSTEGQFFMPIIFKLSIYLFIKSNSVPQYQHDSALKLKSIRILINPGFATCEWCVMEYMWWVWF